MKHFLTILFVLVATSAVAKTHYGDFDVTGQVKADVVSEHTAGAGVTIDGLLIKDGAISESDPVWSAADAFGITTEDIESWDAKQNRVTGTCTGQVIVAIAEDGTVTCEDDDSGSGGSALEVEDESVSVDTAVTKLNFLGDGISAVENADHEIDITVSGGSAPVDSVNGETGVVVLDTADISEATDKNYVTDAQKTVIGNTSGTNTGDQTETDPVFVADTTIMHTGDNEIITGTHIFVNSIFLTDGADVGTYFDVVPSQIDYEAAFNIGYRQVTESVVTSNKAGYPILLGFDVETGATTLSVSSESVASGQSFSWGNSFIFGQDGSLSIGGGFVENGTSLVEKYMGIGATASDIPFTPFSTIEGTTIQAAIEEVFNEAGGTDDQTAAEVSVADAGGLTAQTDVEGYLAENRTAINLNTAKNTNISTSLSVGTVDTTTVGITSDGGADDVIIPAATSTTAGVATAAQATKLSYMTVSQAVNLDTMESDIATNNSKEGLSTGSVDSDELASTAVTPGAYTLANITVDADGRITAATSGTGGGDITGVTAGTGLTGGGLVGDVTVDIDTGYLDTAISTNSDVAANTAKSTNATHTGDVTGATALTIAAGAVDIAHLSATGTKDATTFLRGDNTFAVPAGGDSVPDGTATNDILQWDGAAWAASSSLAGLGTISLDAAGNYQVLGASWLDDTKTNGDTGFLWSADKIFDELALKVDTAAIVAANTNQIELVYSDVSATETGKNLRIPTGATWGNAYSWCDGAEAVLVYDLQYSSTLGGTYASLGTIAHNAAAATDTVDISGFTAAAAGSWIHVDIQTAGTTATACTLALELVNN